MQYSTTATSSRAARRHFAAGVAIVVLIGGYFWNEIDATARALPPRADCHIQELVGKIPSPQRLARVADSRGSRIVWIGVVPRFTIRSGPPCYIFDDSCVLTDWTNEVGEGWRYDYLYHQAFQEPPLSIEEALAICAKWHPRRGKKRGQVHL
jgi:hypothetical protein